MPSYLAVPNPQNMGVGQSPYAAHLTNPEGSPYAAAYNYAETELLRRVISDKIFNSTPKPYESMRAILNKPVEYVGDDVFTYLERGIGRAPIKVKTTFSGGSATGNLVCVSGAADNVTVNKILQLPGGAKAIVTGITVNAADDTLALKAPNGSVLPASIAANTLIPIQMGIIADGLNVQMHYDRLLWISRTNYIQLCQRDERWTRMEKQKHMNQGVTDYMAQQKLYKTELLFQDTFISMFTGKKGEFTVTLPGGGTTVAKSTDGLFTTMQDAGSWHATTSASTLLTDFEQGAFATNYLKEGSVRYVLGTSERLYELSKLWKEPAINYTPNDTIADLNLREYRIGSQRFVPIEVEVFKETSMFTTDWAKRLLVIDPEAITPMCMTGYMPFETGETNPKGVNGSINDYQDFWIQAMLGTRYHNPLGGFWLDQE